MSTDNGYSGVGYVETPAKSLGVISLALFDKKKRAETVPEPVAEPEDSSTGTAEDVQAIMEKYDRESNTRRFEGVPRSVVRYLLVAFSVFVVYMNLIANWEERIRCASFVGIVVFMVFILFPARKHGDKPKRANYIPWYDVILGLLGGGSFFYFVINFQDIVSRATRITTVEVVIGVIGILILLEACRRSVGIPIIVVVSAFLIYAFASGYTLKSVAYNLFYTLGGVLGTPTKVCSTFIVLFILFGSFLEKTGISDFFISIANSVAGASSGGPAKVAVISSALCGMVSGSSVANTVTTGSITIPMMKKTGYKGEFAGAVEAAASTGGQIMPPVMGAAAFIMAEMTGVPYGTIAVKAILPAVLYFTGIFMMVHLEAKKLGLRGLSKEDLPKFGKLFISRGYLLLPLVVLVYMIINGFTMSRSAMFATAVAIAVSMFRKDTRLTPSTFLDALENGARSTLSVAVACAVAGIIAGVVSLTGIGQLLIRGIVAISGNVTIIALFLTMISCIILGMGVPTTANYIIMATTCAPILVTGMGIPVIAAHMFVFYFGIVADITPPVALAAYAGSAIANSNPMKTGITATRLAIGAFIVPYIFALNPAMLFIDTTALEVIQIVITSLIGIFGVSAGMEGYMKTTLNWPMRILSIAAGLALIYPGLVTDLVGAVVIGLIFAYQVIVEKKAA